MHSPPLVLLTFQMGKQLESFKTSLEDFAGKYKQDIRKNPEFRGHFQQMCARIGVDPLACKSRFLQAIVYTILVWCMPRNRSSMV